MNRILVATDGSPSAGRAVDFAARLAAGLGSELSILTAMQLVVDADLKEFARAEHAAAGDVIERETMSLLAKAKARAAELGALKIKTVAREGDPPRIILDAAQECEADIVVMGKRGRGRLEGLLLGSVSQKVVSLAARPVLVVP